MVAYPTALEILPTHISFAGIIYPSIANRVDQGYETKRLRYTRSRAAYRLDYINVDSSVVQLLSRVYRYNAIHVNSFEWTHPYTSKITSISADTPNQLVVPIYSGLVTGDSIIISGSDSHDGTYTITLSTDTVILLDGTIGGIAELANGVWQRYYSSMILVESSDDYVFPVSPANADYGKSIDGEGLVSFSLLIREV